MWKTPAAQRPPPHGGELPFPASPPPKWNFLPPRRSSLVGSAERSVLTGINARLTPYGEDRLARRRTERGATARANVSLLMKHGTCEPLAQTVRAFP